MSSHDKCNLCGAARITVGMQVNDGSFTFECGSVIRGAGMREPDVRVIGNKCARWARDLEAAYERVVDALRDMDAYASFDDGYIGSPMEKSVKRLLL